MTKDEILKQAQNDRENTIRQLHPVTLRCIYSGSRFLISRRHSEMFLFGIFKLGERVSLNTPIVTSQPFWVMFLILSRDALWRQNKRDAETSARRKTLRGKECSKTKEKP